MLKQTILTLLICILSLNTFAEMRAGIAVRNVNPAPLLPVSGGLGPANPTFEKKGDLTVRALVLENNGIRMAIVSVDFIGFPSVLCDRVRAQVKGIPPKHILIGSTHTHSAPDIYGFPDEQGNYHVDLDYIDMVCSKTAEAINEAVETLQPCTVKINTGEAKGKIAFNYYAPQLYDPRCNVLQCIDKDGNAFATFVNYAIHPEALGPNRGILSPDMVGPLYDRIAEKTGGTGIFMNGAQGGMVTADNRNVEDDNDAMWQETVRIGHLLAEESLRIIQKAPTQENPELFIASIPVTFPNDNNVFRYLIENAKFDYPHNADGSVTTQVAVVNIGNAQMLTIPGEALPNIGYYLKRKMHGEHNFLLGLTNDAFGYILLEEDFNSYKRYEYICRTSLGEMTGEIFIEQALALINRCPKSE